MRIHIIACRVMMRQLSAFAAHSQHIIEITWLPQGLHNTPGLLKKAVQQAIDAVEEGCASDVVQRKPDYLVLGYGLCSNGVVGLKAGSIPLVIPRTDDCIAIFLGSQQRYLQLFNRQPGTYWLNAGWIENAFVPTRAGILEKREQYVQLYTEDNADFLLEQDLLWMSKYTACAYIESDCYNNDPYLQVCSALCAENGWKLAPCREDPAYFCAMTDGSFINDGQAFLLCPPGKTVAATGQADKIQAID